MNWRDRLCRHPFAVSGSGSIRQKTPVGRKGQLHEYPQRDCRFSRLGSSQDHD